MVDCVALCAAANLSTDSPNNALLSSKVPVALVPKPKVPAARATLRSRQNCLPQKDWKLIHMFRLIGR